MSEPIVRIKLYEDVANHILNRIRSEDWRAGCRLPAEGQLAAEFDVSRSTVREAVRSLQVAGILRSRSGSGTFVAENAVAILEARELTAVMGNPENLRELVQARYVLEPQLAALAARAASPEEAARLMEIVDRMQERHDRSGLMVLGYSFHLELAKLSHNAVLTGFYQSIASHLRNMRVLESLTLEIYLDGIAEHRGIAAAVAAGDQDLACRRMQEHLRKDYAEYLNLPD